MRGAGQHVIKEQRMPCYSIEGVIPVVDPSSYVHPTAVLIGDVIVGPDCYMGSPQNSEKIVR